MMMMMMMMMMMKMIMIIKLIIIIITCSLPQREEAQARQHLSGAGDVPQSLNVSQRRRVHTGMHKLADILKSQRPRMFPV
jgi:hypothetical protein